MRTKKIILMGHQWIHVDTEKAKKGPFGGHRR